MPPCCAFGTVALYGRQGSFQWPCVSLGAGTRMNAKIAFLACPGTLPGSPTRRLDAQEHDLQFAALAPDLAERGMDLVAIDWHAPDEAFAEINLALLGTVWDYTDDHAQFLRRIERLTKMGVKVCNSGNVVRWNSDKRYLRDLERAGIPVIETLWLDQATGQDIVAAFDHLATDRLVLKKQIGAGAEGQHLLECEVFDPESWSCDHAMMAQAFLPAIQTEGEYSFVFVAGQLSHTLIKRAAGGDYRIQSIYGGYEEKVEPAHDDAMAAEAVMAALPFDTPLYARIDMVRGSDGELRLMEAELIEPYLYPLQGPQLGKRMANAIAALLDPPSPPISSP